jgi:hypothetical protein
MSEQRIRNLNDLTIIDADCGPWFRKLQDFSVCSEDQMIKAIFKNLDVELCSYIKNADVVLGCVAWLTHFPIDSRTLASKNF